jgi:predicted lipid-binding transport protein (Tim44 family)
LSFVFDGALTSLPPHVLITSDPSNKDLGSLDWLIRKYAVTVLPSIASLKVLRGQQFTVAAPKPMIGFGDPVFDRAVQIPGKQKAAALNRSLKGDRWKGIAESGSALAAGLDAIATADPSFDAKHFITGARTAYEMVVTSFAKGDRRQLRSLLSREVYNRFDAAITEREGRGETAETRFVSIDGSTVTAAELRDRTAQITVRFVSKLFSATRDRSGTVIDGNVEKVTDNREAWTFARNIFSRDPKWKIVATAAEQ